MLKIQGKLKNKLSKIKILLSDVDGVLTDGGMYFTENGLVMKKFNVKDGMGSVKLREKGFEVGIITTDTSPMAKIRSERLNQEHIIIGTWEKKKAAEEICSKKGLSLENIAFIGDDVNDLELLKAVGFSAAPKDAVPQILDCVDYVCKKKGGDGCFREIADMLLYVNK